MTLRLNYLTRTFLAFAVIVVPAICGSVYWVSSAADRLEEEKDWTLKRIKEIEDERRAASSRLKKEALAAREREEVAFLDSYAQFPNFLLSRKIEKAQASYERAFNSAKASSDLPRNRGKGGPALQSEVQEAKRELDSLLGKAAALGPSFSANAKKERDVFAAKSDELDKRVVVPTVPHSSERSQLIKNFETLTPSKLWTTKTVSSLIVPVSFFPAFYLVDLLLTKRDRRFRIFNAYVCGSLLVYALVMFGPMLIWAFATGFYKSSTIHGLLSTATASVFYVIALTTTGSWDKYVALVTEPENERQRQLAKEREEARIRAEQQKERDRQYAIVRADREKQEVERRQAEEKRQREIDERNKKAPQRIAAMEYKATELYVSYSHKWTSESPVSDKTISTVIDMIRRENDPDKRESMFDRLMSNIHFAAHKCHLSNLYKTYGERIEHRITPSHFTRLLSNVELRVGAKVSVMLEHFESLEGLIHMAVQRNDTQWKEEKHEEMADEYMKQFEDH